MNDFQIKLKKLMDEYVHFIYDISASFPKEETYGIKSQIRRAAMSVILNYIEGYARRRIAVRFNFMETSYGSLQESRYILYFSCTRGYIKKLLSPREGKWLMKSVRCFGLRFKILRKAFR